MLLCRLLLLHVWPFGTGKNTDGNTPLHSACECRVKDLLEIVQMLLAADPQGVAARTKDRDGNLVIHSACEKTGLPGNVQAGIINALLEIYPESLREKDKDGNLPLHSAIETRTRLPASLISTMVQLYGDATKVKDKDGQLPLHSCFASCTGQKLLAYASVLLDADPASALVASPRQGILLHHVCHRKPIVLPLVQKLCNDPRAALQKDNQGNLPIHVVLERRDLSQVPKDVMLALIRVNPASMREKDHDGNLPLHSGLERGDAVTKDVIKAMLDAYPGAAVVTDKGAFLKSCGVVLSWLKVET